MKRLLPLLGIIAAGCILIPLPKAVAPTCTITRDSPLATPDEQGLIDAINQVRPTLTVSVPLQYAAVELAEHQAVLDLGSSYPSDPNLGSTLVDSFGQHVRERLTACGMTDADQRDIRENIPWGGSGDPQEIITAMSDPTNADKVGDWLDPKYTQIGVGEANGPSGIRYWTIIEVGDPQ